MPITYQARRRVEFSDTDVAGIMHFARFFCFMEEVEHEFLRSKGLSVIMDHDGLQIGWPRVSAKCEYYKPAYFEQELTIHLTLSKYGGKSLVYDMEFEHNGEVLARGQITTCCCLMEGPGKMTGMMLPEEIKKKLEAD